MYLSEQMLLSIEAQLCTRRECKTFQPQRPSSVAVHKVVCETSYLYSHVNILRPSVDSYLGSKLFYRGNLREYISRPSHTHFVHSKRWRPSWSKHFALSTCAQLCFNAQQHLFWIYERSRNEYAFYSCISVVVSGKYWKCTEHLYIE